MWEIIYYQTTLGKSPVFDFIQNLDVKLKSKVIDGIDLLKEFGILLRSPHAKKITSTNLWELRVLGKGNIRIFYVAFTGKNFLLLHGFIKKSQKTHIKEIKIAEDRLKAYILRIQN